MVKSAQVCHQDHYDVSEAKGDLKPKKAPAIRFWINFIVLWIQMQKVPIALYALSLCMRNKVTIKKRNVLGTPANPGQKVYQSML